MKTRRLGKGKTAPKGEHQAAFAYYKTTVWHYVQNRQLGGAEYLIALLAFNRLDAARERWFCSLPVSPDGSRIEEANARASEPRLDEMRPRRLEQDKTITAELLATLASMRLSTPKPKSASNALQEAHAILMTAREYLEALPNPEKEYPIINAWFGDRVSFGDISDSSGKPDRVPFLATAQPARNNGTLSLRAVEMALKRHPADAPKEIQQEIRQALKNKEISCYCLEEIRWHRFRKRFKGR
jgi:hypothetical protein